MYSWPTYHVLDHEGPFGPHLSHKVVDIDIIFLLQSLHHCINSNECASSAHTSTAKNNTHIVCMKFCATNYCAHYSKEEQMSKMHRVCM